MRNVRPRADVSNASTRGAADRGASHPWHGLQEEGTHAMWEFAVHDAHHETFSYELITLLLKGLGSEHIRARLNATSAIWHLTRSADASLTLVNLGCVTIVDQPAFVYHKASW